MATTSTARAKKEKAVACYAGRKAAVAQLGNGVEFPVWFFVCLCRSFIRGAVEKSVEATSRSLAHLSLRHVMMVN